EDGRYVVRIEVEAAKYRADGKGKETPDALDDWIDIGVFGERDPKGPSEGRLLAMEKRHVDSASATFEMVVDQAPKKAGVDPFNKLIDRDPDDDLVTVVAGAPPERLAGNWLRRCLRPSPGRRLPRRDQRRDVAGRWRAAGRRAREGVGRRHRLAGLVLPEREGVEDDLV